MNKENKYRKCNFCKQSKELLEFAYSRNTTVKCCKQCKRLYDKERYRLNRKKLLEQKKEYNQTKTGKLMNKLRIKKYMQKDRSKQNARLKVYYAKKVGKLKQGLCEVCGKTETHAHHDNYKFPLKVRWLCALHHRILEGKQIYA